MVIEIVNLCTPKKVHNCQVCAEKKDDHNKQIQCGSPSRVYWLI